MEMLCISTFNQWGKISHLSLNRVYIVKWIFGDKILVKNDIGQIDMYPIINFVQYQYMKQLKT
jgi:hypothetical protein